MRNGFLGALAMLAVLFLAVGLLAGVIFDDPGASALLEDEVESLVEKYKTYRSPGELFNPRPPRKQLVIYRKRVYVVKEGDTLSGIADLVYGDPGRWEKILKANESDLPGPEFLTVGMELVIPE